SASVSTRWIVPPGTAARAAAFALSASLPVRSVSVTPLAVCPPLVGSKLPPLGAAGAAGAPELGAVVVDVVWALLVPMRLAPIAPPVRVVATSAAPTATFRTCCFIVDWPLCVLSVRARALRVREQDADGGAAIPQPNL